MRRTLVTLALGLVLAAAQGCASMGVGNPFSNDPLTGGADAASSQLLGVPLPAGMQRYASHGYMNYGADGGREGLETLRGNVDAAQAAQSMFTACRARAGSCASPCARGTAPSTSTTRATVWPCWLSAARPC